MMRGRFLTGLAAGALIGATASIMAIPQMSYKNRSRVNKMGRQMAKRAGSLLDDMRSYSR